MVENAFNTLKLTFRELHGKIDLDVTIVPNIVTCFTILHNVLLNQSHDEVARLLEVICAQNEHAELVSQPVPTDDIGEPVGNDADIEGGVLKCQDLGVFLTLQRAFPIQPIAMSSSLHLHSLILATHLSTVIFFPIILQTRFHVTAVIRCAEI